MRYLFAAQVVQPALPHFGQAAFPAAQAVQPSFPQVAQAAPVQVACWCGAQEARARAPAEDRMRNSFFMGMGPIGHGCEE